MSNLLQTKPTAREKALLSAAKRGDARKVKELLQQGVNVNARGTRDWETDITVLMYASEAGHLEVVKLLVAAGADLAIRVKSVAEKGGGATALHYALKRLTCEKPDPRLIQVLLEAGADPNARLNNGNSVLDEAASLGHIDLVELLLKAGAEPNPPENSIGQSALCAASGGGHVEMVRLLLDRGANVNCVDAYKATPLMAAAHAWRIEIVDILLGAGANVNVTDWKERTPLIHASLDASDIASQQDAERALSVMRGLIEAGASVNVKDIKGRTALDYALQSDRKELGQYLKGQGAKPGTKAR